MSSSKPQICFLLALWGKNYIRMFCDVSLRSLLAEGNIPALTKEYPCTFTLLTTPEDIPFFESQPIFPSLKRHCTIRYVDIKDTIFHGNHSATLTLALERGMRSQGDAMLNTYFIFLVADYLFASHALSGLLPHIRAGVSAITAGNYQVVEEEVLEDLKHHINPATGTIAIPNRELVAWSLRHLHPMTVANTIGAAETHALHTNRLFWRVDDNTLLGRFYLRHMLCIRPEIDNYVIGSSCDYSYIEEMCPSGNVAHLADSDEYFVVELQPLLHEEKFIDVGPHRIEDLTQSLAQWTTSQQRANAHMPVVFHADGIPASLNAVREESKQYVQQIEAAFATPPCPVRGHYYWLSCIQWIMADIAMRPGEHVEMIDSVRKNLWESPVFSPPLTTAGLSMDGFPPMRDEDISESTHWTVLLARLYVSVFGKLYAAYLWHPHFLDYQLLARALSSENEGRVLLILPPKRIQWIEWSGHPKLELRSPLIACRDLATLRAELKGFSSCIIHLPAEYDALTGTLFDQLSQAMPADSKIHIFVKSPPLHSRTFSPKYIARRYAHLRQKPDVYFIEQRSYTGLVRRFLDMYLCNAAVGLLSNHNRPFKVLWYGSQVAILHLCYVLHNALSLLLLPLGFSVGKNVCSTLLTFKVKRKT